MPAATDLRTSLATALAQFTTQPLPDAAREFFKLLGYESGRTLDVDSVDSFCQKFDPEGRLDHPSALKAEWKSVDLLFQLTDQELSTQESLFQDNSIQQGLFQSYVFFAIELTGGDYARGTLTGIARRLNRIFPMPVMVLIKHQCEGKLALSIAVINRRRNKVYADRDVLEKATIIRDIALEIPHRGHLDILASLAFDQLVHPEKKPITDFDTLHAAWEQIFNVELLNKRFYRELANWYFWALPQVDFPADLEPDDEKRRATGLIRLLTRLIFCWFLKEKGLIPEKLFHPTDLAKILQGFDPESEISSTYYQGILQNLFFATLNQRMGKDSKGQPYRRYVTDEDFHGKNREHGITNLYRYPELFTDPQQTPELFADIPFLNGGLFECLDREDLDHKNRMKRLDGFTTRGVRPTIPDRLFFDRGETADLSAAYGDKKRKQEPVTGLIPILNRYKFTIVENTPIDQEIALDPELLGKVFENLLASYNEETKTTARKQTGSFYTPRPIVDYMVDESLKAHFTQALGTPGRSSSSSTTLSEPDAHVGLDILFAYTEKEHAFSDTEVATLIRAIDAVKVLDPACGSGAFPMGVLHKLVYILGKLDPDNERWKQTQLAKLDSAPMRESLERDFEDNDDDYGRKLYLIENCLYGVDIQPIAIQITKLRFFISLVCDQTTNRNKKNNHGIRPLPNLETKFVAANTLIGLPVMTQDLLVDPRVGEIEKEIESLYHGHFSIQRRDQKLTLQRKIRTLRKELGKLLGESLLAPQKARHVAEWDAFDPQATADFFDPHWMFGRSLASGFDITIGNPPYVRADEQSEVNQKQRRAILDSNQYETLWEKWDLYVAFLERGYKLLRPNGVSTMIVSDAFCHSKYAQKAQNWFLENSRILRLDFCGELKIFEAAVHNVITSFQYTDGVSWKPERRVHRGTFGDITLLPTDEQAKLTNRLFFPEDGITQAFSCKSLLLETICYISVGMVAHADEKVAKGEFQLEDLVSRTEDAKHSKPFVEGKHLERWLPSDRRWLEWGTPRSPALLRRKTFEELYTATEKIISVDMSAGTERLRVAYDDNQLFHNHSAWSFVPWLSLKGIRNRSLKKAARYVGEKPVRPDLPKREELEETSRRFSVKYLLGVMNSGTARDFLRANRRSNIHLYPDDWKRLPIPDVPAEQQQPIGVLVDRILTAKRANPGADIADLETRIDAKVATLYGIAPNA